MKNIVSKVIFRMSVALVALSIVYYIARVMNGAPNFEGWEQPFLIAGLGFVIAWVLNV